MTITQHTPGPWQDDGNFIVAPDPAGTHPDIYIAEIVEADEEGRCASKAQQGANGRLIAAVPELLDCLLDIKHLAEKSGDSEAAEPFTLLDMIAYKVRETVAGIMGGQP
jgi:hypothetical protein